jgi:hypothetical protein
MPPGSCGTELLQGTSKEFLLCTALTSFSRRESFHAWRTFASAYPIEFSDRKYRYHLHIRQPSLAPPDYFRGLSPKDPSWWTCLRISPKETRVADLVPVSNISNLALLDLSDGQVTIDTKVSVFNERVMRTWAELVSTAGAFEELQILLLGWQEHVSTWLFQYLQHFPKLRYVVLTDCPLLHQKNRKEWEPKALLWGWEARHAKRSAKRLKPCLMEKDFHSGAVSGLLYPDEQMQIERPVLEMWLGNPRPWTHIVDDFPSTRTIFFERSSRADALKRMADERPAETRSPPAKRMLKPRARPGTKLTASADDSGLFADISSSYKQ